jgi:hypothetical protein
LGDFFAAWVAFFNSKVGQNNNFENIFEFGPFVLSPM